MFQLITGMVLIFLARVTDVSMATVRTLMIVRGKRLNAAVIGFFEVIVYILALNKVVSSLDKPLNLFVYALGFSAGNYLGSYLEEKLALGNISAQIVAGQQVEEIINYLREEGFGLTVFEGWGKEGPKKVISISLKRKDLPRLFEIVEEIDGDSFVTVMDTRTTRGGYFKSRQKAK